MKKLLLFFAALLVAGSMMGQTAYYEKVTSAPEDWTGDYLIAYVASASENALIFDGSLTTLDAVSNTQSVLLANSGTRILATTAVNACKFTVAPKTGSNAAYSLKSASGNYISGTTTTAKASNGIKQSNTDANYEITFNVSTSGEVTVYSKSSDQNMTLRYNSASDQARFRFYKSGQQPITLFKYVAGEGGDTPAPTTYNLTFANNAQGSFSATVDGANISSGASVEAGKTVTLSATPADGYAFNAWNVYKTANQYNYVTVTNNTFTMPSEAVTVDAYFMEDQPVVTIPDAVVNPAAGAYNTPQTVTITNLDEDNYMYYYTIDGNDPTYNSTDFPAGGLRITSSCTLKILTIDEDENSTITSFVYTIKPDAPTFSVAAGSYTEAQTVTISAPGAAYIYYTTSDEDIANMGGTEVEGESATVTISESATLKAVAIDEEANVSDITSATYVISELHVFASLEDLVAADLESGALVTVSFQNVAIKSVYTSSQNKRQGVYFNIQKDGHDIEIYYASSEVPAEWEAGGTLTGTISECPWTYYERGTTWELAPEAGSWDWNSLAYTEPSEENLPTKYAFVVAYGNTYYAAGIEIASSKAPRVEVNVVDGVVYVDTKADRNAIAWNINETANGFTISPAGSNSYLKATASGTDLALQSSPLYWKQKEENGNKSYWISKADGTQEYYRTILYQAGSTNAFKAYTASNIGAKDYASTAAYAMPIVVGPAPATLSFEANEMKTYSSAYPFEVDGAEVYTATVTHDQITLYKVESAQVPAGVGVILYSENGGDATISKKESATELTNNHLQATTTAEGALVNKADVEGDIYVLADGNVFLQYTGTAFAANRAFVIRPAAQGTPNGAPMRVVFATEVATDIEAVETGKAVKFFENGVLYIQKNGRVYNVAGMIVK